MDGAREECTGNQYAVGGTCQVCEAPNVVDETHQRCTKCVPGKEPNQERNDCVACANDKYSSFGNQCQRCASPNVINANRTSCSPCPAGQGEMDGACEECTGNQYAVGGTCQVCEAPNVVDETHQR